MPTELAENAAKEFALAREALAGNDTLTALARIERALKLQDRPEWYSLLGYCIARERGQQRQGLELCRKSLAVEPAQPVHFLFLARIHLINSDKETALQVLREGMAQGGNQEMAELLEHLGRRKPPVFSGLSRRNPLNRYAGLLLSRLGRR